MALLKLLSQRAFMLLASGEAASLIGDQFTRIAVIWLILDLTESPVAVGVWLAFGAVPRAVFLLVGGALIDRFSPRSMMILANVSRLVLVAILTVLAATGGVTMTALYVFAVLFGMASALYVPSISVIVPRIVPRDALQAGNSVVQGLMHLANLVGPPLAAALLAALLGTSSVRPGAQAGQGAYAPLFAIDSATYLVSLLTLSLIGRAAGSSEVQRPDRILSAIYDGLVHVWRHPRLRIIVLIAVVGNFGLGGPLAVGLPLLAKFVLPEGVIALGVLSAAASTGSLVGLALAALLRLQDTKRLFAMPFVFLPVLGGLMASLGSVTTMETAGAIIGLMTMLAVYLDIQVLSWLQRTTDERYLGRVMSILQFGALGLMPISMALAGVAGANLPFMFEGFGGFVVIAGLLLAVAARGFARTE